MPKDTLLQFSPSVLLIVAAGYLLWPYVDPPTTPAPAKEEVPTIKALAAGPGAGESPGRDPFSPDDAGTGPPVTPPAGSSAVGPQGGPSAGPGGRVEATSKDDPPEELAAEGPTRGLRLGGTILAKTGRAALINGRIITQGESVGGDRLRPRGPARTKAASPQDSAPTPVPADATPDDSGIDEEARWTLATVEENWVILLDDRDGQSYVLNLRKARGGPPAAASDARGAVGAIARAEPEAKAGAAGPRLGDGLSIGPGVLESLSARGGGDFLKTYGMLLKMAIDPAAARGLLGGSGGAGVAKTGDGR